MNGLEFLNLLKKNENFKVIPVVVLTTSADPYDRKESFRNNVAGYMLKSLNYSEFLNTIEFIKNYWRTSELSY